MRSTPIKYNLLSLKISIPDPADLDLVEGYSEPELCFSKSQVRDPAYALLGSGATHVLLLGHMLPKGARSFEVTVNLAVGKEKARCWRNEVYAEDRAHPLLPLGRLANLLDTKFVWEIAHVIVLQVKLEQFCPSRESLVKFHQRWRRKTVQIQLSFWQNFIFALWRKRWKWSALLQVLLLELEEVPQHLAQLLSPLVPLPQVADSSRRLFGLHACTGLLVALSALWAVYLFSVAGCGSAGSAAIGGGALCEGISDGSSAVAGKLLAALSCLPLCADALAFLQISMTSKVRWPARLR